jgi:hypothetical protein
MGIESIVSPPSDAVVCGAGGEAVGRQIRCLSDKGFESFTFWA